MFHTVKWGRENRHQNKGKYKHIQYFRATFLIWSFGCSYQMLKFKFSSYQRINLGKITPYWHLAFNWQTRFPISIYNLQDILLYTVAIPPLKIWSGQHPRFMVLVSCTVEIHDPVYHNWRWFTFIAAIQVIQKQSE